MTSSVFGKAKTKPISHCKGDTACIVDISEDLLYNGRKENMNEKRNCQLESNSHTGDNSHMIYTKKDIGATVRNDEENEINTVNEKDIKNMNSDKIQSNIITLDTKTTNLVTSNGRVANTPIKNAHENKLDEIREFNGEKDNLRLDKKDIEEEKESESELNCKQARKRLSNHFLPTIFNIGEKCENPSHVHIHSWSKLHPFSFLTGVNKVGRTKTGNLFYPSPAFINSKEWQKKPDLSKDAILEGMVIDDKVGLVLVDKQITKKFRGLVSDMIKQILKAAFGGPPVSLKVQMFEPKSTLQRITDYWSFAPQFLTKAASLENPVERMKQVIVFAIAGFYIPTKQLKPFNPNIGETFQGEFENGSKIYVEHISHYPTVSRFLILDENFKFHGYFDFSTETERFGSRIKVNQKGPITVEFPKLDEKIVYNMPTVKLLNASSEEGRSAIWINTMLFSDVKNSLKAVVKFGTNSNYIHGFEGCIIEGQFSSLNNTKGLCKYDHAKELEIVQDSKIECDQKKSKNKILAKISGSWLKEIKFNDEVAWNIDTCTPNWIRPLTNVLPSDGRFREDLIWLYRMFNAKTENEQKMFQDYSQGWKVTIEITQRAEREIRKKLRPKINKK